MMVFADRIAAHDRDLSLHRLARGQGQGQSGQDYSEAAAKLPNEIATPGAAPPKDNKAPGGGSEGTAIE